DPVGLGSPSDRNSTTLPGPFGRMLVTVVVHAPDVRLAAQDSADGSLRPLARSARPDPEAPQLRRDAPDGPLFLGQPAVHHPNDGGLRLIRDELAGIRWIGPVSIGDGSTEQPAPRHLAPAPLRALLDLGALVLRDDALDVLQELAFGSVGPGGR